MITPLGALTVDVFAGRIGELFALELEHGQATMELVEVTRLADEPPPGAARVPFSLVFRGPPPVAPQRIYGLEHPELGRLELFVVPIAQDADGVRYEAVFA